MEILTKAGGNAPRRMKVVENLVGDVTAGAVLMMEFPSAEAAKSALDSDAYKALLPDRAAAGPRRGLHRAEHSAGRGHVKFTEILHQM